MTLERYQRPKKEKENKFLARDRDVFSPNQPVEFVKPSTDVYKGPTYEKGVNVISTVDPDFIEGDYKVIDDNSATNKDTTRNKMEVRHTAGNKYTDIVCTCTLDYGEPTGQAAFDNTTNFNGDYVFDELGLKSWEGTENGSTNKLLTHVVFHPVQKSLNRLIQIDYTLRIQSLTTFTETSSTALSTSNTVSGTTSGSNTGY